jgi:hypothetical protein
LELNSFEGAQSKCGDSYSFTSFDCELHQIKLGYDDAQKAFTWHQVGTWRSSNDYGHDVFVLDRR